MVGVPNNSFFNKMRTVCLTYIYQPFWGTEYFLKSCETVGMPVHNAWAGGGFRGHAETLRMLYQGVHDILYQGYTHVIYADAADSVFFENFTPPDKFIYQAEKACYPHTYMAEKYLDKQTPWCYLNAGGWCAPVELAIEFFERFGLTQYNGEINGQHEQMLAYFQALEAGFPIELDQQCKIFQSVAFEEPGEFGVKDNQIYNLTTETKPKVFHGNGRTSMDWVYDLI